LFGFRFYVEVLVGGDFEGEVEVQLVAAGGSGQKKVVGETCQVLGGFGGEAGDAGGEPGLRGDGDLGAACGYGAVDFVGGVADGGGEDRRFGGESEPALLFCCLAGEAGVGFAAGAHETGADGGDADAFVAKLGVEAFGVADEGEFAGYVGEQVGNGYLAADAGDVDDGCVAVDEIATEQVGQRGLGGVESGEEVGGHGAAVGVERLIFYRAYFDDAGVVNQDVDAAEVADGVVDEHDGLIWVSEIGGDEEDVFGECYGAAFEEGLAGGIQFVDVAGGQNEFGPGAGVAFGQGEAEAAGASGDEDDLAGAARCGVWFQGVGGGCGDDAGEDLSSVDGGSGFFHTVR